MSKNPVAVSLSMLNRFAGSPWVHRLGIYKPAQQVAHVAVREGFRAGAAVMRQWKDAQQLVRPARLGEATKPRGLFDLNPTEEQQMVREMAQRFARDVVRPAAHAADAACAPPKGFDARFAELGLASLAVPEALGGSATEASVVTGVLSAEALAWGDLGLALAALAPLGVANAISRWGSSGQQSRYLPPFTEATAPRASLALAEPHALFEPTELATSARADGSGFVLNGDKSLVPLAESAELLLVAANLVGQGPRLFIVERGTRGVSVTADPALGARAAGLGRISLNDVGLPAQALLGEGSPECDFGQLVDLSRIALCALAVGTAQAVLDYVIPYCNQRKAFGEPISHRQAVAFMVADLALEIESMRLLTWRAASRAEEGLSFHREAYLARVLCAEKGLQIATNGVQLLGGHGYSKDHPVERWYRDLMAVSVMEGGLLF